MKEHILVVDDDKLFLDTVSNTLTKEGYSVVVARSGYEAIQKVKQSFFMLIILDIRMPELDGIETLKKIREIEKKSRLKTAVIIITGYADEMAPVEAIKLGAVDYIFKPFDSKEFLFSVNRSIKTARLEKEREEYLRELKETKSQLILSNEQLADLNKELEKKVEERTKELKDAQAKLIQSAKMSAVGQLGAGVAHELNNPMGGSLGYTQLILSKINKPHFKAADFKLCKKYLKYIEKELQRCKSIVENLLTFSRKSRLPFEPLDIRQTMENTLSIMAHQLNLQNIKVSPKFPSDLAKISGNANQLQQVFTNLILNARQAMPKGGELKITAKNIKEKGEKAPKKISIAFSDTGCGIAKKHLDKIFEPFFTTKTELKATGLGLSISYQIIKDHKGEIEVKSESGKGTAFIVTIPTIKK